MFFILTPLRLTFVTGVNLHEGHGATARVNRDRKATEVQYYMRFPFIACIRFGCLFHRRTDFILLLLDFTTSLWPLWINQYDKCFPEFSDMILLRWNSTSLTGEAISCHAIYYAVGVGSCLLSPYDNSNVSHWAIYLCNKVTFVSVMFLQEMASSATTVSLATVGTNVTRTGTRQLVSLVPIAVSRAR